jgi:signal transduction histidine kinase
MVDQLAMEMRVDPVELRMRSFIRADQFPYETATGLGLAVVRRLVEAHAGRASFRSRPGQGSTFSLHLPLGPQPVAGARPLGSAA